EDHPGLLGGVVDGGGDAVQLVQPPLHAVGAGGAGHSADGQFHLARGPLRLIGSAHRCVLRGGGSVEVRTGRSVPVAVVAVPAAAAGAAAGGRGELRGADLPAVLEVEEEAVVAGGGRLGAEPHLGAGLGLAVAGLAV